MLVSEAVGESPGLRGLAGGVVASNLTEGCVFVAESPKSSESFEIKEANDRFCLSCLNRVPIVALALLIKPFSADFPDDAALRIRTSSGHAMHASMCSPHRVGLVVPGRPRIPFLWDMHTLQ